MCFFNCPAEGNHKNEIFEPHLFPDLYHGLALKGKTLSVTLIKIARSSPETYHGIIFYHLKIAAPKEASILVGFEVAHLDSNWLRVESRSNSLNSLSKLLDKIIFFIVASCK